MDAVLIVICALVALAAGPFINVLVDRVPQRRSLFPLQARCPAAADGDADDRDDDDRDDAPDAPDAAHAAHAAHAGRGLSAWVKLGAGRCPACGARLSPRYPLVAVVTAALFAAAALRLGADAALPAYLLLFGALVAVTLIDLEHFIIPNRIVYPAIFASVPLLTLAAAVDGRWRWLQHALIGAVAAWAVLLLIHLVVPSGMGFGDVRLAFLLGLFLGWLSLSLVFTGLFLGFLLGAVTGVVLILAGRRGRKDAIPFGPFLAAGAVLAVLAGAPISRWLIGR